MRKHQIHFNLIAPLLFAVSLALSEAAAETVQPLIEFEPDTPAFAVEVNANFDEVKIAVDDNAGDIDQLETDVAGKQDVVTGACAPGTSIRAIGPTGEVTCEPDNDSGGDITGVTVGPGLIGGGTSGAVSVEADTSFLQRRIGSSCTPGSSIRAIAADGTVICQTDADSGGDITGLTVGPGLIGGGTTGAVSVEADTSFLQRRIGSSCTTGSSIRAIGADGTVTCQTDEDSGGDITGLTVGPGLIGGGTTGAVSVEADTSFLQRRVGSSCTPGSSIRAIGVDGTVTCQTDEDSGGDISEVTAGSGLTGGGTEGNVTLSIPVGGVTNAEILNGTITDSDISAVAAIGISKILGASGIEFTTELLRGSNLPTRIVIIGQILFTAPGPGFIVVLHSGSYAIGSNTGEIGIGTSTSAFTSFVTVGGGATTSPTAIPYMVMDIVEVDSAGSLRLFALARTSSIGATGLTLDPRYLAAIFIPNRY